MLFLVEAPIHLAIKRHGQKYERTIIDSTPVLQALASSKKKLEFKEGVCNKFISKHIKENRELLIRFKEHSLI